jgi:hypothetical protein
MKLAPLKIARTGVPAHPPPASPRWTALAAARLAVFRRYLFSRPSVSRLSFPKSSPWKSSLWKSLLCRVAVKRKPKSLSVRETASLGDRRFVSVVQFERQRFLIGSSPSSITLLSHLPDESSSAEPAGEKL